MSAATVDLCCEICGVSVLTAKIRIAPSIPRDGWRCSSPACSPARDSAPGHQAGAPVITTTTATVAKRGGRFDGT